MPGNFHDIDLNELQSWPTPNFVDPVRRTWLPGYSISLQVISTILVATRLWLRGTKQAGMLGLDDLLLIPTWLSSVGFTICSVIFINLGGDRHVWDVLPEYFAPSVKNAWVAQIIYLISTTCVKVSVLLFYRRLVAGTYSKRWKYATIGAIAFTIAYCIAFLFVLVFGCQPTESYWMAYDPTYLANVNFRCINAGKANLIAGVLSVWTDLYAVLLPCLMLRHFDAPRRQKIALNIVFSFGLLVVAAGAVRTYYFSGLAYTLDETWLGFDIFVWAQLELQLAIICASAPALRVFFRRYLSDPLNRAIHTARMTGSAVRSGNRNSTHLEHGVVHYPSHHSRAMSDVKSPQEFSTVNEYVESKPEIQTYYRKADDHHENLPPKSAGALSEKSQAIRTPADFENHALRNLERNRPFPRPVYIRPGSETSVYGSGDDATPAPHSQPHAYTRQ